MEAHCDKCIYSDDCLMHNYYNEVRSAQIVTSSNELVNLEARATEYVTNIIIGKECRRQMIEKNREIINKYMLSYSAIDDWIYGHSVKDDYKDLDEHMKNILTMINSIAVYLGVKNDNL